LSDGFLSKLSIPGKTLLSPEFSTGGLVELLPLLLVSKGFFFSSSCMLGNSLLLPPTVFEELFKVGPPPLFTLVIDELPMLLLLLQLLSTELELTAILLVVFNILCIGLLSPNLI